MATINAYYDESGGDDGTHVVFAGLWALQPRWREGFNPRWRQALQESGVTSWRTVNAAHRDKQFKKFRGRDKELRNLALRLTDLICEFAGGGLAHSITNQDFKNMSESARKALKKPFWAAFQVGLQEITSAENIDAGDAFSLICDDSPESVKSHEAYVAFRLRNPKIAPRLGGICFVDDKLNPPVQAADLFAFCCRKRFEGKLEGVWAEVLARMDSVFSVQEAKSIYAPPAK
jgi:hypothetical protein